MPTSLRSRLSSALIAFAWNEWGQMGVLATPERTSPWAQDPEALLVFTFEIARDEPRLFDEVLDWLVLNESLVSARRLRAMCRDSADERLVESVLAWVGERHRRKLATKQLASQSAETLFRSLASPIREKDQAFASYGFLRPRATPSRKSHPPDFEEPINLAFRLRQLLGVSARAEVIRCLLTLDAPWATAAVVSRAGGYAKRNVQEALASLEAAGTVSVTTGAAEQRYSLDRGRWANFLEARSLPVQRDWPQLLAALRRILRWLDQEDFDGMSEYMRGSRARDLLEEVHHDLAHAGIAVEYGRTPEATWGALTETIERALSTVSARGLTRKARSSLEEGQTGYRPPGSFEVYRVGSGSYAWRVKAANGQVVAQSPDHFDSEDAAHRAARDVRDHAQQLHYDIIEEPPGARWRARTDGRAVAFSCDVFASRSNANRAADRVRDVLARASLLGRTG